MCYQLSSRVERWHLNWLFPGHKLFNETMGRKRIQQSGVLAASLQVKLSFSEFYFHHMDEGDEGHPSIIFCT